MLTSIKSKLILVSAGMVLLFGCATTNSTDNFSIKKIDSEVASIGHVSLQIDKSGSTHLRGAIQPKSSSHGTIPGHIHVEIISPSGKVTEKIALNFKRKKRGSTHPHFYIKIDEKIIKGSVIKVRHDIEQD